MQIQSNPQRDRTAGSQVAVRTMGYIRQLRRIESGQISSGTDKIHRLRDASLSPGASGTVYYCALPGGSKAGDAHLVARPKRSLKDAVLTSFASIPDNALQIYRELHPEDTETEAQDIEIVTIKRALTTGMHNDMGTLIHRGRRNLRDRLMLFEFQTDWDGAIAYRMMDYLVETIRTLAARQPRGEKMRLLENLPEPELYCLYPGPSDNRPSRMSFARESFGVADSPDGLLDVRMVYDGPVKGGAIDQMLRFSQIEAAQRKELIKSMAGSAPEAIARAIAVATYEECIRQNVLAEYLQYHTQEVLDMMTDQQIFEEQVDEYIAWKTSEAVNQAVDQAVDQAVKKTEEKYDAVIALKDEETARANEEKERAQKEVAKLRRQLAQLQALQA